MNENKPEYGEPWNTGEGYHLVRRTPAGYRRVATIDPMTDTHRETKELSARIVKLINLFAGVSDKVIDTLTNPDQSTAPDVTRLIFAMLTNPSEGTAVCMLVDALQDTPEYQKQLGCYRTWKQMYDMLNDIGVRLQAASIRTPESSNCARDIFRFLAPLLIESNPSRFVTLEPREEPT